MTAPIDVPVPSAGTVPPESPGSANTSPAGNAAGKAAFPAGPSGGPRDAGGPGQATIAGHARGRASGRGGDAHGAGRTFTIELPAGMKLLNTNDRSGHWARRHRLTAVLRETAGWLAKQQHIPHLERAHILGVYEPPDRRIRDAANWYPSFKACVDGIVGDAKVLPGDDAAYLDGPDMRMGPVYPRGRLVLYVTELVAEAGAA